MNHYYIGLDKFGSRRVWGKGADATTALRQCIKAVSEYSASRPDRAPLSIHEYDSMNAIVGREVSA